MRILHLTSHLSIGGITRYVLSLSKRQVHSGHQVVIAADGKITGSPPEMQGITHWQYPLRTSAEFSLPVFWSVRDLEKRLRRFPVDIVHAHTRVGQVMADQISRRLRIPYVTTWHGIYKKRLGRRLWPCAGEIAIAISDPYTIISFKIFIFRPNGCGEFITGLKQNGMPSFLTRRPLKSFAKGGTFPRIGLSLAASGVWLPVASKGLT